MNIVNKNNQQIYRHKSIRLKEYDYSQPGAYFVTVCTHNRASLFGKIIDGEMVLNDMGKIVGKCILDIPVHFSDVEIDKFVIMPNHVHLIIIIYPDRNSVGAQNFVSESCRRTACRYPVEAIHELPLRKQMIVRRKMILPKIIGRLKMNASKQINILNATPGHSIWQRNYYEHVIRDEKDLNKIRRYIINNPPKWEYDRENQNGLPIDEKKTFWSKFLNELID